MQLSQQAVKLLKHVLTYNGEEEVNEQGAVTKSALRLNPEEASQRRHFFKAVEAFDKESDEKVRAILEPHNNLVTAKREASKTANPQKEGEDDKAYENRITQELATDTELQASITSVKAQLDATGASTLDVTLSDKTLEVVKKYFKAFGEKAGYAEGDDSAVADITTALGL